MVLNGFIRTGLELNEMFTKHTFSIEQLHRNQPRVLNKIFAKHVYYTDHMLHIHSTLPWSHSYITTDLYIQAYIYTHVCVCMRACAPRSFMNSSRVLVETDFLILVSTNELWPCWSTMRLLHKDLLLTVHMHMHVNINKTSLMHSKKGNST